MKEMESVVLNNKRKRKCSANGERKGKFSAKSIKKGKVKCTIIIIESERIVHNNGKKQNCS